MTATVRPLSQVFPTRVGVIPISRTIWQLRVSIPHTGGGDPYIKSTLDALTGVLWADDNAIIKIEAEKYYSDQPRVEIVMKVEDDNE